MDKQLKPCPFCGCPAELYLIPQEENPEWFKKGNFWRVRCSSEWCLIGHSIKYASEKDCVIAEWNRRKRKNKAAYEHWGKRMDKQKQIEEMAKIMLEKAFENYETSGSVEIDTEVRRNFYSAFLVYCEALYNAGYRKIPENAVVLTREEY